jgi:ADP-ribose pyrophosphatase
MPINKSAFSHNDYEIIKRDVMYQGFVRLARYQLRYKLFDGGWSNPVVREVMERVSAVGILPYDPVLDKVVLIEQFRIGTLANPGSPWVLEIIAGCIDEGEPVVDVARREAQEEADCIIEAIHPICDYFVSPGANNEYMHLFCGKVDASNIGGVHGLVEENENICAYTLTTTEAFTMLRNNEIKTAPAIMSLLWLQANLAWLKSVWQK